MGPFRTFQKCCQVFLCHYHFADATRFWFQFFSFSSRTWGEMIGKFALAWFFEQMGLVQPSTLLPVPNMQSSWGGTIRGSFQTKGYTPRWMVYSENNGTPLFFNGWFGVKPHHFLETSKSSAWDFSQSWHLWPVFALWIGWWRKVPPGSEGMEMSESSLCLEVQRFEKKTIQRTDDVPGSSFWIGETSPCFFCWQFQFNYFLEKSLSYLVFFCVLVAASCWVIMILHCYGTSFPLNLAPGRRTMSDAVEDGMDLSFGGIWCIHAKSTPPKGKPLFQPPFFLVSSTLPHLPKN